MAAPLPLNEKARLKVLRELLILDTASEVSFDELTKLAAQICQCPFSIISLVDQDRQWFKSTFNLAITETPRSDSFCAYTILENEILIIPDAKLDERFSEMATVTGELNLHFYAGVPISFGDGINLGSICVFDSKPHQLTSFQTEALKSLSKLTTKLIDGRKSFMDLQDVSKTLIETEKRLAYSAQIQALAEMTGGVAHEINSPLSVIKMTLDILKKFVLQKMNHNQIVIEQIGRLEKATDRIQNLTSGLMTYSRDSRNDTPSESLFKKVITDTMQFCKDRLQKSGARLIIEDYDDRLVLECNPVEISQVLLNLVHNACDAVKDLPEKWIRISIIETISDIQISVIDSGSGIPEKLRNEIFKPFFTTKMLNQGTGFGLSICRGIIERHQGTIAIDTNSTNTSFVLKLPKQQTSSAISA